MHKPKFELYKSIDGKYYFHFVLSNGRIIYVSQLYDSKEAAKIGIAVAKKGTSEARIDDNT